MIYVMQLLVLIDDLKLFEEIFSDISDVIELGFSPTEACNDLLASHYGITIDSERQLEIFTDAIQNKWDFVRSAIKIEKMRRAS